MSYSRASTNGHLSITVIVFGRQSTHWLLFQPLYNGHFLVSPRWPFVERLYGAQYSFSPISRSEHDYFKWRANVLYPFACLFCSLGINAGKIEPKQNKTK